LHVNPAFQELYFGDWEGKTAKQISTNLLEQFYSDPANPPPPNGENFSHFQQRIIESWQSIYSTHQDKRVLLTSHSGVISIILAYILRRLEIDTASEKDHFSVNQAWLSCPGPI